MNFTKKPPRIVRFLLGGGVGVVLYYAVFLPISTIYDIYVLPASIGFVLNTTASFLIQKYWTFENKNREAFKKQAKRYFIMCGFFYFANIGILYIGIEQLHLAKIIAQIISTAILMTISYMLSKMIFKNPEQ